jgi:hypothetical protein
MKGIYRFHLQVSNNKGERQENHKINRKGHSYSFSSVDMLLYVVGMELPLKLLLSA